MNNLNVTKLSTIDIEDAKKHFEVTLRTTFADEGIVDMDDLIEEEIIAKYKMLDMYAEDTKKDLIFLIAKHTEKIVGIASISPTGEIIKTTSNGRLDGVCELGSIFVLREYQQLGVGTKLIKQMMSELKSRGVKEFYLDSGYPSAQKIWSKKFGVPYIHLKDYWGIGKDHMIWHCKV